MIHHISIPATDPASVADALAALTKGRVFSFHPVAGAWIVLYGDAHGSAIEVYPADVMLRPGRKMLEVAHGKPASHGAFHAAIATPLEVADISRIADENGWTVMLADRGPFELVEVWVDDTTLLELLTPAMQAAYRRSMSFANWAEWG